MFKPSKDIQIDVCVDADWCGLHGVMKFFPGHGKFLGTLIQINEDNVDGKPIRVQYEDGEEEDYSQDELDEFQCESSIPIGALGFRFVKKFRNASGIFSGKVIKILAKGAKIYLREFDDGERHTYSLDELEFYAVQKFAA